MEEGTGLHGGATSAAESHAQLNDSAVASQDALSVLSRSLSGVLCLMVPS